MSYDNAEPKPLKFLISDGKMIDDEGNVIADSLTLKDFYDQSSPQVKKYLLSDGSVVDENNNLIIKNDYYKKMYDQTDPKVAKYLHSDGTIDENPGSGDGADLENNHQTTIDVSTYTEPVEIEPTAGKDGMKKATVTLSNIPSGGSIVPPIKLSMKAFKVNYYDDDTQSNKVAYLSFIDMNGNYITDKTQVVTDNIAYAIIINGKTIYGHNQNSNLFMFNKNVGILESSVSLNDSIWGTPYPIPWDEYGGVEIIDDDTITIMTNASDQITETFTGWSIAELVDEIPTYIINN